MLSGKDKGLWEGEAPSEPLQSQPTERRYLRWRLRRFKRQDRLGRSLALPKTLAPPQKDPRPPKY